MFFSLAQTHRLAWIISNSLGPVCLEMPSGISQSSKPPVLHAKLAYSSRSRKPLTAPWGGHGGRGPWGRGVTSGACGHLGLCLHKPQSWDLPDSVGWLCYAHGTCGAKRRCTLSPRNRFLGSRLRFSSVWSLLVYWRPWKEAPLLLSVGVPSAFLKDDCDNTPLK